jgi:eukaryotic-like serine/threonine-protein kinase
LFDSASHGTAANETAEQLLAQGRERADRDFAMQPALHVEILALIGDLERRSGHPKLAEEPLEQAAALAKVQFGVTDRRTLHVEYLLAKEADELGRVRAGIFRLQTAVEAFESGPNRDSPEEVQALAWLAGFHERGGDSAKAIDVGERALALARRVSNDDDALTEAVTNLGWIQMDAGHPARAEPLLREALARERSRLGDRHPDVADAMAILVSALLQLGRSGESEQLMRAVLDIDANAYTRPSAHVAGHFNELANVFAVEGKFEQAHTFYSKAIGVYRALAPMADLNEPVSLANVARLRFRQGAYAEAEAGLREAIELQQRLLGADYEDNGRSYDRACLAEVLIARGHLGEARVIAADALAEARRRHSEAHPDVAFALTVQAELMVANGIRERAVVLAGDAVAMYAALADQGSEKAIRARLLFGETLQTLGRNSAARPQLQSALAAANTMAPATPALVAHAEVDLARVDASLGDRAAAARMREHAQTLLAEVEAGPNAERNAVMGRLRW